jgi:hypothetical protein
VPQGKPGVPLQFTGVVQRRVPRTGLAGAGGPVRTGAASGEGNKYTRRLAATVLLNHCKPTDAVRLIRTPVKASLGCETFGRKSLSIAYLPVATALHPARITS